MEDHRETRTEDQRVAPRLQVRANSSLTCHHTIQVLHSEVNLRSPSEGFTLAMKPRADVSRSPWFHSQGSQDSPQSATPADFLGQHGQSLHSIKMSLTGMPSHLD